MTRRLRDRETELIIERTLARVPPATTSSGVTSSNNPRGLDVLVSTQSLAAIKGADSFVPGPPGVPGAPGSPGAPGAQGSAGIGTPGFDGRPGKDSIIPGPPGAQGATGSAGSPGAQGPQGAALIGFEWGNRSFLPREPLMIPGATGAPGSAGSAGSAGAQGSPGPAGPPGIDAKPPREPLMIPGPTGAAGAGGLALTTVECNLGAAPNARRSGHVQITGLSGLTAGKSVFVQQAAGPYTGKGTRADEAEMDMLRTTGKVLNANTIDIYWEAIHRVRGNFKFDYAVAA